jgi:hypothetical protein
MIAMSDKQRIFGQDGFPAIALLLCASLIAPAQPAVAQTPPAAPLNIVIVEGDGAINNLRQRVVREPIVRVEDENHKPVAGAAVTFLLPSSGAGGTFANGASLLTVTTDAQGRAIARGIHANNVSGKFDIQVRATMGSRTGSAVISQTNAVAAAGAAAAGGISAKLILILVAVAGGVAAGAVAATRGGSNSNTTTTQSVTVLTPGGPSVGAPH